MYEVKRIEAQDLLTTLKGFAFEQSPGLRNGLQSGFEVHKAFYHTDPIPHEIAYKVSREMCKSAFGFVTFQTPPVRNKRSFSYVLTAGIERTLPTLNDQQLRLIHEDLLYTYCGFEEIEEGALCESSSIEFSTSDHEQREIEVSQKYELTYNGDTIHEVSSEDVLYGMAGIVAEIAPIESDEGNNRHYVPEPIEHESLPAADNVIANLGFWSIVEPFGVSFDQGVTYRSAAVQMRAIVQALHTGNVM